MNFFLLKDIITYIKNYLAQLSICYKEIETLFDSGQCNTRGKINKLRLIMQSCKMQFQASGAIHHFIASEKLSTLEKLL